jgi:hypothetical protein
VRPSGPAKPQRKLWGPQWEIGERCVEGGNQNNWGHTGGSGAGRQQKRKRNAAIQTDMMADDSTGAGSGGMPTIQEINNFREQAREMPPPGVEPDITAAERVLHERDAEIRAIIASAKGLGKPWADLPAQYYISRAPRARREGVVSDAHRRLYTWIEENETEPERIRKWRVEAVTADAAFWARQPDLKSYLLDIMLHKDNARPEVPHAVRHLHAACMVMGAQMVISDPENLNAWAYQAMYPLLCLQQRARGGRRGSIFDIRQMAKSMIDYLRGEHIWELLVDRVACRDNAEAEQVDKERVRAEMGTTEEKAAEALKRTAERLADMGKLQQAGVQLGTNGKFASRVCTPKIEEVMAKKWRTNEPRPLMPPVSVQAERAWLRANKVEPYQLEGGAAVKQLFKSAKGKTLDRTAGPGFGGTRFSHVYDALSVDTFEDRVLDSIAGQINLFLAGRVPAAIMPLLCRVFSLHEGLVIGDPLAGMLASMNVKDLLDITAKEVTRVTAYADNFVSADTLEKLQVAYVRIRARGEEVGCIFEDRPSNCIYIPPGSKHTWTKRQLQEKFPGFTANVTEPWIGGHVPDIDEGDAMMVPNAVARGRLAMPHDSEDSVGMRDIGIPKIARVSAGLRGGEDTASGERRKQSGCNGPSKGGVQVAKAELHTAANVLGGSRSNGGR